MLEKIKRTIDKVNVAILIALFSFNPQIASAQGSGKNTIENLLSNSSAIISFAFWFAFFNVTWNWLSSLMGGSEFNFKGLLWCAVWLGLAIAWQDLFRVFGLNV